MEEKKRGRSQTQVHFDISGSQQESSRSEDPRRKASSSRGRSQRATQEEKEEEREEERGGGGGRRREAERRRSSRREQTRTSHGGGAGGRHRSRSEEQHRPSHPPNRRSRHDQQQQQDHQGHEDHVVEDAREQELLYLQERLAQFSDTDDTEDDRDADARSSHKSSYFYFYGQREWHGPKKHSLSCCSTHSLQLSSSLKIIAYVQMTLGLLLLQFHLATLYLLSSDCQFQAPSSSSNASAPRTNYFGAGPVTVRVVEAGETTEGGLLLLSGLILLLASTFRLGFLALTHSLLTLPQLLLLGALSALNLSIRRSDEGRGGGFSSFNRQLWKKTDSVFYLFIALRSASTILWSIFGIFSFLLYSRLRFRRTMELEREKEMRSRAITNREHKRSNKNSKSQRITPL